MNKHSLVFAVLVALLLATPAFSQVEVSFGDSAMDEQQAGAPGAGMAPLAMQQALMQAAATVCNPPVGCEISDFQRSEILPGIVHYSAIVQVGLGVHDKIGLHRVVRENRPGHPIKAVNRVFLQHGDAKNFVGMFLPALYSPSTPTDFGIAVYLARRKVDVWGIDQGWALVPQSTTDFGFMADWGLQRQIDDLRSALAIARETRRLMRGSDDRFNLLGYSSGGITGYALLNEESQLPRPQRHVQGFVAADIPFKTNSPEFRAVFCGEVDRTSAQYDAGIFEDFVPFQLLGNLARNEPSGDSPILPGLNNLQAALFFGAGPIFGDTPIHYHAGVFESYPFEPIGLQYVTTEAYLDFLESAVVYEPTIFILEYSEILCDVADSPFDDFLWEVTVPVFNWGGAGGIGPYGADTLPLLGSKDVSEYIVTLRPPDEVLLDFAHIDLFNGENAPEVAWPSLLSWIQAHR